MGPVLCPDCGQPRAYWHDQLACDQARWAAA